MGGRAPLISGKRAVARMKTEHAIRLAIAGSCLVLGLAIGWAAERPDRRSPECYEDEVAMRDTVPGAWECVSRDDLIVLIDSRTGEPIGD